MSARVFLHSDRLAIQATFRHKDACKAVPGARWDKTAKVWTYPATPGAARAIHEHFPAHTITWADDAAALLVEAERIADAAAHKRAENLPDIPRMKTAAWQHQRRAFWYAVELMGGLPDASR